MSWILDIGSGGGRLTLKRGKCRHSTGQRQAWRMISPRERYKTYSHKLCKSSSYKTYTTPIHIRLV